ncbi:MAG: hypothetical protein QM767_19390 [Anaeromyxobacter sp.]
MAEGTKAGEARRTAAAGLGSMGKGVQAAVDYFEGTTQAVADGVRTFQDRFEMKSILDPGAETGLVGALLTGYARYFEGMAKVSSQAADKFKAGEGQKAGEAR